MAVVEINPVYRFALDRHGLRDAEHFLALEGVIVSGHPDRHVARVTLGTGPTAVAAFLKREHRVRWRDRLANACARYGFVTRSRREAVILRELRRAGIGCPEWIAAGEDRQGRAFLLVRELEDAAELRHFLHSRQDATAAERRRFARRLGQALARVHNAGFDHPDLYAKHVLVHAGGEEIAFLDWQRCRRRRLLGWQSRARGLAALDASLADDLLSPRERLSCLRAYCREAPADGGGRRHFRTLLRRIRRHAERLLRRPRIRELRHTPLPAGLQNLIWLDGEALCVTREFRAEMTGQLPGWLVTEPRLEAPGNELTETRMALSGARQGTLVRRRASRPWWWLWCRLRRRPATTPEFQQAATLFRLQRHGIGTPRLLAVGQRATLPWRTHSLLLTEQPPACIGLAAWLQSRSGQLATTVRGRVLLATANVLARLHEANHYLDPCQARGDETGWCPLLVSDPAGEATTVLLSSVAGIRRRRRPSRSRARRDLAAVDAVMCQAGCSATEREQFFLHYQRAART